MALTQLGGENAKKFEMQELEENRRAKKNWDSGWLKRHRGFAREKETAAKALVAKKGFLLRGEQSYEPGWEDLVGLQSKKKRQLLPTSGTVKGAKKSSHNKEKNRKDKKNLGGLAKKKPWLLSVYSRGGRFPEPITVQG